MATLWAKMKNRVPFFYLTAFSVAPLIILISLPVLFLLIRLKVCMIDVNFTSLSYTPNCSIEEYISQLWSGILFGGFGLISVYPICILFGLPTVYILRKYRKFGLFPLLSTAVVLSVFPQLISQHFDLFLNQGLSTFLTVSIALGVWFIWVAWGRP